MIELLIEEKMEAGRRGGRKERGVGGRETGEGGRKRRGWKQAVRRERLEEDRKELECSD